MSIAICGGAGYIGSHVVQKFLEEGREIIVVDNLEYGHKKAIAKVVDDGNFYEGNIGDADFLRKVFKDRNVDTVVHLCAYIEVGESVVKPDKYYTNNLINSINLLNVMKELGIKNFIFSSTAAVYGEPEKIPLEEDANKSPTNTYGETKLAFENVLKWYSVAYDLHYVIFRYFNVAGAHPTAAIGEDHSPESHLIPLVLQVALGKRENIKIFGDDYPTRDGTCVRDYIHVCDLANAHSKAADYLYKGGECTVCNIGNGSGFTVKEIIDVARKVTGHAIPTESVERRGGDSSELVASSDKARSVLGFKPEFDDINTIIETAWNWHKNNPNGFK